MTIKEIVKEQSKKLKDVTHIPIKEVELLVLHILQKNIIWLHLNYEKEFEEEKELIRLVEKRATNYPLEYLTNKVSFYGENFFIEDGVLIPRPETEILVEKALELIDVKNKKEFRVLEIGVGSGVISVSLAMQIKNVKIVAVDINEKALSLALKNAQKHNVDKKIEFIKSDLFENVAKDFDLVVSNPPYIANSFTLPENVVFEPKNALFGGLKGDELLKDIIDQTAQRGIKNLICEMGYDQRESLSNYFKKFDTKRVEFYKDLANLDRGFLVEFK